MTKHFIFGKFITPLILALPLFVSLLIFLISVILFVWIYDVQKIKSTMSRSLKVLKIASVLYLAIAIVIYLIQL